MLLFVLVLPAGFAFELAAFELLEVLLVFEALLLVALVFAAGEAAGVAVAVALVLVLLALVFAALLAGAASPQAIPRALRPRTVESTITFFISRTSLLSSSKLSLLESLRKPSFFSLLCSSFKRFPSKR